MRKTTLILLLGLIVIVSGCSSGDESKASDATGASTVTGRTKDGAKTMGAVPGSIPSEGIVMQPSDPNNPVYKADPNLRGGG